MASAERTRSAKLKLTFMATPLRTLIVEDSDDDTELLVRELRRAGYQPTFQRVETAESLNAALDQDSWDVVISDYTMPHLSGLEALKLVHRRGNDIPFIILSGSIGEEIAVGAMRAGAHDYIMKDNRARLIPAIQRELKEALERRDRRLAEEQVHYLAYHDPLTNLPNRIRFLEHLTNIIRDGERNQQSAALLVLDLNHFREINDTLGHNNGDILLREAGQRLLKPLRSSDMAARLGGDDFAVLLSPAERNTAELIADEILQEMLRPFEVAGFTLEVGAKIGIALFPDDSTEARQLLQQADVAMSLIKHGAVSIARYDGTRDPSSPRRLLLMRDLRAALSKNQLQVHYQPKINIQTGQLSGVEALARWSHTERGIISPDEFIPLAEKTGVISTLTLYMLESCARQSIDWQIEGHGIPIAINLSVKDLLDRTLIDKVEALLCNQALNPNMLEFEITESILMEDPEHNLEILRALRDLQIRLSIDDFGTGYSSLAYLKKLPVSAIKIDQSFVADMAHTSDSAIIVQSTIELAHNLGLKVIAEGVENQTTWDLLAGYGCDEAQGFFISPGLPAEDIQNWTRDWVEE